jgi:hypothetical protein
VGVRLNAALAQGLGVERGTAEARGGKEKCSEKWEGFGVNWRTALRTAISSVGRGVLGSSATGVVDLLMREPVLRVVRCGPSCPNASPMYAAVCWRALPFGRFINQSINQSALR